MVPVSPDTTARILEDLVSDPKLARAQERWLLERDATTVTREDALRVHTKEYVDRLWDPTSREYVVMEGYELRAPDGSYHRYDPNRGRIPLGRLVDQLLDVAGGTIQVLRAALDYGRAFYLAGGMHHAMADQPGGFCIINDIVIAARALQASATIESAWIIDTDAHKGDGTAALTHGDTSITTLSVHMAEGWPLDQPAVRPDGTRNPSFTPSDIDVPIASGEEGRYIPRLEEALEALDEFPRPDVAVVVYGADPYEHDGLPSAGLLRLPLETMGVRDRLILDFLTARDIPTAYLRSGGYGERAWEPVAQFVAQFLHETLGHQTLGE